MKGIKPWVFYCTRQSGRGGPVSRPIMEGGEVGEERNAFLLYLSRVFRLTHPIQRLNRPHSLYIVRAVRIIHLLIKIAATPL